MVAAVGAGSASASAEQLAAKPQLEETAVHDEELRIAAEFAEHGFASLGGLLGDLGTLLSDADLPIDNSAIGSTARPVLPPPRSSLAKRYL